MKTQFNLLPQAYYVQNLLTRVVAVLDLIPEGDQKAQLVNSVKVFETTVVETTWSDEDIRSRDEAEGMTDEQVLTVLSNMVTSHECLDDDWYRIDSAIESVREEENQQKQYRVEWCIDIDATSAEEAAKKALRYQRDTESTATVFEVCEVHNGDTISRTEVDLLDEPEQADEPAPDETWEQADLDAALKAGGIELPPIADSAIQEASETDLTQIYTKDTARNNKIALHAAQAAKAIDAMLSLVGSRYKDEFLGTEGESDYSLVDIKTDLMLIAQTFSGK